VPEVNARLHHLRERYYSHYFYSFRVYPPSECISNKLETPEFSDVRIFRQPSQHTKGDELKQ
jgi:PhoPQ-activated pathogenicity-related protein